MKSGWKCSATRLVYIGLAFALSVGATIWWWSKPRTPEALYRARCAACHALPDLSCYADGDMAGTVATMRARNGADAVIDEEEADVIVRYLEQAKSQ
jgi:hypothetical protein